MLQFFVRGIDILGLGELTASKFLKSLGESNTSLKGYLRRYFGKKAILKKIWGTWYGSCEGFGAKGVWKVTGKKDIVHQL